MKFSKRSGLLWTSATLALFALAWMGAVLYVQLRVKSDLAALRRLCESPAGAEARPGLRDPGEIDRVQRHGCQALPRLFAELRPEAHPVYLDMLHELIRGAVLGSHFSAEEAPEVFEMLSERRVDPGAEPEERARQIDALRAWWTSEGTGCPPVWRFWSTACGAKR